MGLELDAGGVCLATTIVASLTRELTEGSGPQDEVLAVAPRPHRAPAVNPPSGDRDSPSPDPA